MFSTLVLAAVLLGQGEESDITAFIRGDANNDLRVNIADAIAIVSVLFGRQHPPLLCGDAADANNDGAITIADPLFLIQYQFGGGIPPPSPFPAPGLDTGWDQLACGIAG